MVSSTTRLVLRLSFALILLLVAFYVGRPLYWKLSATIQEIREKKQPYSVKQGISQFARSVGWVHDESDAGISDDQDGKAGEASVSNRRLLLHLLELKRGALY